MAKGSGGTRGASGGGGMSIGARQLANRYLGEIKNPALKKSLAEGLEDFEKEFGIPEGIKVSTSDLGEVALGNYNGLGKITINSKFESGQKDATTAKRVIIHELAHAIDRTSIGRNTAEWSTKNENKLVLKQEYKPFEKSLAAGYKKFKLNYGTTATKQIGSYALTNKHEFFAEAISHHLTGTVNPYTTGAYNLAKKMTGK